MARKKTKINNDQVDFLSNKPLEETQLDIAKKMLLEAGYKVSKVEVSTNVTNVVELKNYFYGRLYRKYPKLYKTTVRNVQRDVRISSLFLEARMKDGTLGKKAALQECVDIIDVIFDYESEFGFKYPIKDIGILGQRKLSWVTQKAIEILNRKRYKDMEQRSKQMLREMEDSMEIDLDDRYAKLSNMLSKMGGDSG